MDFETFLDKFDLRNLDNQQKEAVQTTEGPVLLLAVPGSGKTTTLVARLGYLIYGRGVDPRSILTMTYTVAATKEMKERFAKKFGDEYSNKLEFRTINGVCAKIIYKYEQTGHTAPKLALDNETAPILQRAWCTAYDDFPTESDIKTFRTAITNVKNRLLTKDEIAVTMISSDNGEIPIKDGYENYIKFMRENNLMDFDDQLVYAYAILRKNPNILNQIQNQYHYICVDETQDTSKIQHKIIQLMAQRSRNIFMVGDEDQSIYGFRAACPQELMDFEKTWQKAKVLFIENNYRSTPEIVFTASNFIRQNKSRRDKHMNAVRPSGEAIKKIRCKDRIEQYELLRDVSEANKGGGKTMAVLYRNNDTALPLIDLLAKRKVPYSCAGTDSAFFTSRIVTDIYNILQLALNPFDGDAFMQIYYKIGLYCKKDVAVRAANNEQSVWDTVLEYTESKSRRQHVRQIAEAMRQIRYYSAETAIRSIRYEMGYGEYLERSKIDTFRLDILELLAKKQKSLSALYEHLDELKEAVAKGNVDKNANLVLSTIHSSKGLEYDTVFLADVADGIFPSKQAITDNGEDLEEERRLFYVGLTRAKTELALMDLQCAPSSFIRQAESQQERDEREERDKKVVIKRKPRKDSVPYGSVSTLFQSPNASYKPSIHAAEFPVGAAIRHKVFGNGIVLENDGQKLKIDFNEINCEKQIHIDAALSVDVLWKI